MIRVPENTRERILIAALTYFENHGYKKTTIDEIARAAGVGKGTVYLHFKDKDDLFLEVINHKVREMQQSAIVGLDDESNSCGRLTRMVRNVMGYLDENPLLAKTLSQDPEIGITHLKPHLEKYTQDMLLMIEKVLLIGIDAGDIAPIDVRLAAFVLYNSFESFYITKRPDKGLATSDKYIEFMQRLLREGIATQKQTEGQTCTEC